MSDRRCCCTPGTYTKVTQCACTGGANPPTYVDNYTPDLGCVWLKDAAETCWFAGPESPTKSVLDGGDVLISGATLNQVEYAELACCACCECGTTNATPIGCFDTPGTCDCCPGTNDGAEWLWTWNAQSYVEEANGGCPNLRPKDELLSFGSIAWKNVTAPFCTKVLSVDATYEKSVWSSNGACGAVLDCSVAEHITACVDLNPASIALWTPVCGERLIPDGWAVPTKNGLSGPCGGSVMTPWFTGTWDSTYFNGTAGCSWTGKTHDAGGIRNTVIGGITFSGTCLWSRVEWDWVVEAKYIGDGAWYRRYTQSGFLQFEITRPPCPGGCGQRARYFGFGAIPPAGGGASPLWVPRSLRGLLS